MRDFALKHRVEGWVKNEGEGSVEALVQGERDEVTRVLEWARMGPPGAQVRSFKARELNDHPRVSGFQILVPDWTRPANR